ncbi:hypothetical protein [Noviherbaspirillum humi]|nr:hypothetical protein [Noviherbaspirillum humi]
MNSISVLDVYLTITGMMLIGECRETYMLQKLVKQEAGAQASSAAKLTSDIMAVLAVFSIGLFYCVLWPVAMLFGERFTTKLPITLPVRTHFFDLLFWRASYEDLRFHYGDSIKGMVSMLKDFPG